MIRRACRWLTVRLIIKTQNRTPDVVHGLGNVSGSLPYFEEWRLFRLFGWSLMLTHLVSTSYKPLDGFKFVLLGWYRAYVREEPRHIVLRDVAGFSRRPERVELPERGNCWLLRLRR